VASGLMRNSRSGRIPAGKTGSVVILPGKEEVTVQALSFARRLQGDFAEKIAPTGITPSQTYALWELCLAPGITQQELARRLDIGKASVGEILTKLEHMDVVERTRSTDDRRLLRVALTPKGQHIMRELAAAAQSQIDYLKGQLGETAVKSLTALLAKANAAMKGSSIVDSLE